MLSFSFPLFFPSASFSGRCFCSVTLQTPMESLHPPHLSLRLILVVLNGINLKSIFIIFLFGYTQLRFRLWVQSMPLRNIVFVICTNHIDRYKIPDCVSTITVNKSINCRQTSKHRQITECRRRGRIVGRG